MWLALGLTGKGRPTSLSCITQIVIDYRSILYNYFFKCKSTSASSMRIPPSQNVLHCFSPSQRSFCQHGQVVQNWIFGSCWSWHCKGMFSFINQFPFFSTFIAFKVFLFWGLQYTAHPLPVWLLFSSFVFWLQIEQDKVHSALGCHGHHLWSNPSLLLPLVWCNSFLGL